MIGASEAEETFAELFSKNCFRSKVEEKFLNLLFVD